MLRHVFYQILKETIVWIPLLEKNVDINYCPLRSFFKVYHSDKTSINIEEDKCIRVQTVL